MTSYALQSTIFVSIIVVFIAYITVYKENEEVIPESHPYVIVENLISSSEAAALRRHFEELLFPAAKVDFSSSLHTNIGEAYDPNSKGECYKPGTVLHPKSNKCILFPRLDAIRNYHLTGGYEGYKENSDKLRRRSGIFINHQFNAYNTTQYKQYKNLFESKPFVNAIHTVCPNNYPFIKPIELNLAIQLPGQALLAHRDVVYFKDATRQTHPLWLLTVMKESGLFKKTNIPQIQGVVYMGKNNKKGGEIYTYPNGLHGNVKLIPPTERSVVIMDGTEIVHGVTVYNPDIEPLEVLHHVNGTYDLMFDRNVNQWRVYVDMRKTDYLYSWDDIRASIAYRALCFENEGEMNLWNEHKMQSDLGIDEILDKFKNDLIVRNKITAKEWSSMDRYNLGKYLMDQYIKLPKSELAWIKINYAAVYEYYCNNRGLYNGFLHNIVQNVLC